MTLRGLISKFLAAFGRKQQTTSTKPKNMSPALIALVFSLVEEAIKIEPALAAEITALFSNGAPTPADWLALRAKVLGESFVALAPDVAAELAAAPVVTTPAVTVAPDTSAAPANLPPVVTPQVVTLATPPATPPAAPSPATCAVCGQVTAPDSPTNCSC
jgi:hypothetical protein